MRTVRLGLILVGAAVIASGCASSQQWQEWKSHPTHFASDEHLTFSARNQGSTARVRRQDQRLAASQGWWGDPVVVRPDQIFGN
jgi:hypothetical protein